MNDARVPEAGELRSETFRVHALGPSVVSCRPEVYAHHANLFRDMLQAASRIGKSPLEKAAAFTFLTEPSRLVIHMADRNMTKGKVFPTE